MLFEYVRLSLFEREGLDLDWRRKADGTAFKSREEWLRDVFSREIPFLYRKQKYVFAADDELKDPSYVAGRIGRQTVSIENEPPESALHETTREVWKAALVLLDPRDHPDGQKVAFQAVTKIGKPVSVFEALAAAINTRLPSEPFLIEAHGIADPQTFWQYVEENQGNVTNITLEVAAPNMFRSVDDFSQEMKELRDTEKVRSAKFELTNPDGLNPNTKRIHDAVDYTVKGGGTVRARAKGKKSYNSRRKTRRIKVEKPPNIEGGVKATQSMLEIIRDALAKVFGTKHT